jgi:hypothetical protein
MNLSDTLLDRMRDWMIDGGEVPAAIGAIRLRDDSARLDGTELILDADEPEEHETMPGMERINGTAVLSVSIDDVVDEADRRWVLGEVGRILRDGTGEPVMAFSEWLMAEGYEIAVYGLRVDGAHWEPDDDRRVRGSVAWACWVCRYEQ